VRGALAITAAFVVVGCSIGALEGFSGGAGDADAAAEDARTNADVVTTADGDVANDGGDAGGDATIDGSTALDCDGGTYLVCATFDQGTVAAGWTGTRIESGGTLGTSNDHRSAPYSMRAQLPTMTTEQNQYAGVYATWTVVRPVRVAFDVKIADPKWAAATDKAFALLHVQYPSSSNETYLFRAPSETTLSIEQNAIDTRYQKVQDLPYEKWVRVSLEIMPTVPTGTLRLKYDGLVVYENASVPMGTPTAPETLVDVGLARFTPPSPALDVLFDNVTIEQIP
jgi:hypothetical protein